MVETLDRLEALQLSVVMKMSESRVEKSEVLQVQQKRPVNVNLSALLFL